MKFKIFKLKFNTPVHFGSGNLDDTDISFRSDRLFSAISIEMLKKYDINSLNDLIECVNKNHLYISDAFPYIDDEYYISKPYVSIKNDNNINNDNKQDKKQIKKMKFLPVSKLKEFINGEFCEAENVNKNIKRIGSKNYITKSSINRDSDKNENATPYQITIFNFSKVAGLYIIIKYEEEKKLDLIKDLLIEVGTSGLGGRKSSGFGKFSVIEVNANDNIYDVYDKLINEEKKIKITISACLPKDDEIETALDGANYVVLRNGGFVDNSYININAPKKKAFYYLSSGSSFINNFDGGIFDVSFDSENPIYRYAKPFFLNVGE